jgi:hypothetical protein
VLLKAPNIVRQLQCSHVTLRRVVAAAAMQAV